jgi:hypothetical protein
MVNGAFLSGSGSLAADGAEQRSRLRADAMSVWVARSDRVISAQLAGYRRELAGTARGGGGVAFRCPRCGLVVAPRLALLRPRHCPRCVARRRVAVELEPLSGDARRPGREQTGS